jgi:tetratricopeptide (TPR) repeat protein
MKSKRKSHGPSVPAGSGAYRQGIRQADEVIAKNGAEIRPDNWQELALDWFAPHEPDRRALAQYISAYRDRIGVAWARDVLRLQVFFQAQDYERIVEHYDRALRSYPHCALIELGGRMHPAHKWRFLAGAPDVLECRRRVAILCQAAL